MTKCPYFGLCGGCKYDFSAPNYRDEKSRALPRIPNILDPIWGAPGTRRRADFAADKNAFGFYKTSTHDIINITKCPNLCHDINDIIPNLAKLPWGGVASVLVTKCENGIVVNATSDVPYFDQNFRDAVQKLPAQIIRFTYNDTIIRAYHTPHISFDDKIVDFPDSGFLQPTIGTEKAIRDLVVNTVGAAKHVVDLFCGIGNFTFATNATGFDIMGVGQNRDLFKKPLSYRNLNQFDAIIMDPPRAGALAQSTEIAKSNVSTVVYVSCNPTTWKRDCKILQNGGYKIETVIPVDQFVGSPHWEIFSVFKK